MGKDRSAARSHDAAYWNATESVRPGHRVSTPTGRAAPSSEASSTTTSSSLEFIGQSSCAWPVWSRQLGVSNLLTQFVMLRNKVQVPSEGEYFENANERRRAHREVAGLEPPERGPAH